jgi:ABC-type nitrate/sulfonate/bicarbonate transport system substrate-binding protein
MAGCGFCVATSAELSPYHPEKVLMMSESFWEEDQERSMRLMAAILEACQMCGDDTHLEYISSVLSRHDYLNLAPGILFSALKGHILRKNNPSLDSSGEFIFFSGDEVNSPSQRKRSWIQQGLVESGVLQQKLSTVKNIYREDIYQQVTRSKETALAYR